MSTKLTAEEIKLRGSLLAKNKDLLKLHKELVFSNILTEEEFWEDRRGLLRAQEMILKQKKGITSSLVSDELKPVSGNSDVKYVLTPTIIQSIFDQHPILRKAFNDLVGEGKNLSEREFWLEYFKSKFFNESKTGQSTGPTSTPTSTSANLLDSYYQDTYTSTTSITTDESRVNVSGQCDISRSEEDHISDYLRYERESVANGAAWNSLRQFNKHSLRVLQALKSDANENIQSKSGLDYIEIPDLHQVHVPQMATLNVQESQLFSLGSESASLKIAYNDQLSSAEIKKLVKEFDKSKFDASVYQLNFDESKKFLLDMFERNNFRQFSAEKAASPTTTVTDEQIQLLNSSIELLRHFWKSASSPVKMTPERAAKLTRLISVLERMEEKILVDGSGMGNLKECISKAKQKYTEITKQ